MELAFTDNGKTGRGGSRWEGVERQSWLGRPQVQETYQESKVRKAGRQLEFRRESSCQTPPDGQTKATRTDNWIRPSRSLLALVKGLTLGAQKRMSGERILT